MPMTWNDVKGSLPMKFWTVEGFSRAGGPDLKLQDGDLLVLYEDGGVKKIAKYRLSAGPATVDQVWATNCTFSPVGTTDGEVKGTHKSSNTSLLIRLGPGTSGRVTHSGEVPPHSTHGATWHGDEGP